MIDDGSKWDFQMFAECHMARESLMFDVVRCFVTELRINLRPYEPMDSVNIELSPVQGGTISLKEIPFEMFKNIPTRKR